MAATLKDQLACAKRELSLRQRVYPTWIQSGRMTKEKSDHEIACMSAVVATLDRQLTLEQVSKDIVGRPTQEVLI